MRRALIPLVALPLAFLLAACNGHQTAQQPSGGGGGGGGGQSSGSDVSSQQLTQMEKAVDDAQNTADQADREAAADR